MYLETLAQNRSFFMPRQAVDGLAAVAPQVTLPLGTIDLKNLNCLLYEPRISYPLTKTYRCPSFCISKRRLAS